MPKRPTIDPRMLVDRILDPRTTNLGSVGVAMVKAAKDKRHAS